MDAIRDSLNEKVEEGMISISMNTSPVFSDGESAGSLMIVNSDVNRYPISVEISRNDTGEVIYTCLLYTSSFLFYGLIIEREY